jgi:hypothetical protein
MMTSSTTWRIATMVSTGSQGFSHLVNNHFIGFSCSEIVYQDYGVSGLDGTYGFMNQGGLSVGTGSRSSDGTYGFGQFHQAKSLAFVDDSIRLFAFLIEPGPADLIHHFAVFSEKITHLGFLHGKLCMSQSIGFISLGANRGGCADMPEWTDRWNNF